MEAWQLLISAVGINAGFIAGIFAEPVKIYFTNKSKKKLLRKSLYAELLVNYRGLCAISGATYLLNHPQYKELFDILFLTSCYKHAKENASDIFYQIEEAPEIENIYINIQTLKWRKYKDEDALK